eukprot:TRINITY_DN1321_c11_g1_i1.p1 TRINITY_DN1321_c11_g1~~TRINITY_DN1321_c11_g1_i1.p1  ORF type:complete len:278 (+),score=126.29 TRINITY_DN1321_c11_g1_i1:50-835(+)
MSAVAYQLGIVREGDCLRSSDESQVILHLTHSVHKVGVMEKRFDRHLTISEVKWKIQTFFGTDSGLMMLQLQDADGTVVADNMDDDRMLGYYSPQDGWTVHAIDLDPQAEAKCRGWTDTSLVQKYMMSDEDYAKRDNSVRAEKARRLEKMRAEGTLPVAKPVDEEAQAEAAAKISAGDRCLVFPGDRKATVRYVGKIPELKPGWWVGVEFDEPVGKNDGTAKGKRYFECRPKYGGFCPPDKVTVGDFPADSFEDELAACEE